MQLLEAGGRYYNRRIEIMSEEINSSKILYSTGRNDEWKTPAYAVHPVIKYLKKDWVVWCPFDLESESEYVKVLRDAGFKVICSHISEGKDFFLWEPKEHWDIIISNPPFTNKREIFKRAIELGKPFMLLMSNTWLNDAAPKQIFGEGESSELELLMFDKRVNFINRETGETCKKGITFSSSYYCRGVLPRAIICEKLNLE